MPTCNATCTCCWTTYTADLEEMESQFDDSRSFRGACEECVTQSCVNCLCCHLELGINKRILVNPRALERDDEETQYIYGYTVVNISQPIAGWITADLGHLNLEEGRYVASPYGETACSTKIPDDADIENACVAALGGTATQEQWETVYNLILNSTECLAIGV